MEREPISRRLSIKQATECYPISRSYIYKLISQKKLSDAKIGGRRVILQEDLESLLAKGG